MIYDAEVLAIILTSSKTCQHLKSNHPFKGLPREIATLAFACVTQVVRQVVSASTSLCVQKRVGWVITSISGAVIIRLPSMRH